MPPAKICPDEFAARGQREARSIKYGDWQKICFKPGGAKMVCRTTISGNFETGQTAVRLYLTEREGDSTARLQLFLPVGLYVPSGVKLSVDKGAAHKIPFTWCLTNTCIAGDLAKPALLRELESGKSLSLEVVDTNMLAVTTSLPLGQLAAVRKGPPAKIFEQDDRRVTAIRPAAATAPLDRIDQRSCRERLCQIGNAAGFHRGRPRGLAVIAGDIDHRRLHARPLQLMAQLDTRTIAQVDIEHEAQRLMKIMVIAQSAGRFKGDDLIAILLEKPMHALQHGRIIINDENGFAARQGAGLSWLFQMHGCGKRGLGWRNVLGWQNSYFPADALRGQLAHLTRLKHRLRQESSYCPQGQAGFDI